MIRANASNTMFPPILKPQQPKVTFRERERRLDISVIIIIIIIIIIIVIIIIIILGSAEV